MKCADFYFNSMDCPFAKTHLHICTFAHLHICTFAHLHICTFAHLHICMTPTASYVGFLLAEAMKTSEPPDNIR